MLAEIGEVGSLARWLVGFWRVGAKVSAWLEIGATNKTPEGTVHGVSKCGTPILPTS